MIRPAKGLLTSGFGVRVRPITGKVVMHEGLDIANSTGTDIFAPADALVHSAGPKFGYGNTVVLDHGWGMKTWYAHTSRVEVKKGQRVRRGDLIARMGSTGFSTGPHLHYEVRIENTPVDPLDYLLGER